MSWSPEGVLFTGISAYIVGGEYLSNGFMVVFPGDSHVSQIQG